MQIFRVGTQTDSAGNEKTWTRDDLDAIVKKYDPVKHEAPVVIGHPKDNAPAWGWIEALKREGDILLARAKQLVPEFVEMVKQGRFKKRSMSLYPDMTLRHVGFLGAMPPAVKGLEDVAFNENETICVESEFEEHLNLDTGGKKEMDEIKELKDKLAAAEKTNAEKDKVIQDFSEKNKQEAERTKVIEEKNKKLESEKRTFEFKEFCGKLTTDGKLTPNQSKLAMEHMEAIHDKGEFEFAEGKKPILESFKGFLNSLSKQIEFGEVAGKDKVAEHSEGARASEYDGKNVDEDRMKLHTQALEYAEKNKIGYAEAVNIIIKKEKA